MKKNINILFKNMKKVALNIVKTQRLLIEGIYNKNIKYYNPGKKQIVLIVIDF